MSLSIAVETEGPARILTLRGQLTSLTAPELERRLAALCGEGAGCIVLGMAGVTLLTSAGLRVFLAFAKRLQRSGGALVLCEVPGGVRDVLCSAGFDRFLPLAASRGEALAGRV